MNSETPAELLQQLLDACNEGRDGAIRLAQRTEIEGLRLLLQESAEQYGSAADDLRTVWSTDAGADMSTAGRQGPQFRVDEDGDPVAFWERAECQALTYFRDAYDTPLPPRLAATVKHHFEAGISRLERLRKLQAQNG